MRSADTCIRASSNLRGSCKPTRPRSPWTRTESAAATYNAAVKSPRSPHLNADLHCHSSVSDGALRHAGNPELISRTHFARHLVDSGICQDTHEVFRRFLVDGRPGYVAHRWARLGDAVAWVRGAGGAAVIAHPGRYKFSANEE